MKSFVYFALALSVSLPRCRADVIIDIVPTSVPVGGTALVDVYARSSSGGLGVAAYSLKLAISPIGAVDGDLKFSDPQTNLVHGNSSYLFAGKTDPNNWGANVAGNFLSVTVNDQTSDGLDVGLGDTGSVLLARLQLGHFTASSGLAIGDEWSIDVVDDGSTVFVNDLGNSLSFSSSGAETLTVVTPEPGTCVIAGGVGAFIAWRARKRQKTQRVSQV